MSLDPKAISAETTTRLASMIGHTLLENTELRVVAETAQKALAQCEEQIEQMGAHIAQLDRENAALQAIIDLPPEDRPKE